MDAKEFTSLCLLESKKRKKKRTRHPRFGFPEYAFSSTPGSRIWGFGYGMVPPMAPFGHHDVPGPSPIGTMGDCGGGGGAGMSPGFAAAAGMGESVDLDKFNTILEGYEKTNPDIVAEVRALLNQNISGKLYHGCDGMSCITESESNPKQPRPTDNDQIAALAASCEASLNAFRTYTGFDFTKLH